MVEGTALEKRHGGNLIEGSNPSLSAINIVLKRPVHLNVHRRWSGSFNLAQNVTKHLFPCSRTMLLELA